MLNGRCFVVMVCSELGLHRELANSVFDQSGVVLGPWRAQAGFHPSSCSILYSYQDTQ